MGISDLKVAEARQAVRPPPYAPRTTHAKAGRLLPRGSVAGE